SNRCGHVTCLQQPARHAPRRPEVAFLYAGGYTTRHVGLDPRRRHAALAARGDRGPGGAAGGPRRRSGGPAAGARDGADDLLVFAAGVLGPGPAPDGGGPRAASPADRAGRLGPDTAWAPSAGRSATSPG